MIADKRRVGEKFEMEETLQALTVGRLDWQTGQRQAGRARHLVRRETIFSLPHSNNRPPPITWPYLQRALPTVDHSNRRQGFGRVSLIRRKDHARPHPGIGLLKLERRDMRALQDARACAQKAH